MAIRGGMRETVLNVQKFFLKEKEYGSPIIPFEKVNERVAAATGVSLRTIARIAKEGKLARATSSKIVTPGKRRKRKTRQDKIILDSFDIGVLRRKIYEFYLMKKEIPTIKKLHSVLKEDIRFEGSVEVVRQYIKQIGFRFKETKTNKIVLMERNDIRAWRARYLQSIKHNSETEKLPVVYLDETYIQTGHTAGMCWQIDDETEGVLEPISKEQKFIIIHAGGDQGFVKNACSIFKTQTSGDYLVEMNHTNFINWVTENLAPNLKEPSLIVMDNAPYHNMRQNKPPNIYSKKSNIIDWLRMNHIEYSEEHTKPQLLEIVQRHKPEAVYVVDAILKKLGHKVLRLPPHHGDLNPIEMVWASMKQKVTELNIGTTLKDMPNMVINAFNSISKNEWRNYCAHVKKFEEEYRRHNEYMDEAFTIQVNSESEDSSDSENSSDQDEDFNCIGQQLTDHNYNKTT